MGSHENNYRIFGSVITMLCVYYYVVVHSNHIGYVLLLWFYLEKLQVIKSVNHTVHGII